MKDYGTDNQADKVIEKLLNERRSAQATADKQGGMASRADARAERKRVSRGLGLSAKSPFVLDLIRQYGQVPESALKEIAKRKMRWGL